MVTIAIPLKWDAAGAGGNGASNYQGSVDLSYNIYNAKLILFNIANSRMDTDGTYQGHFGLSLIPSRHSQNDAWNTQYSASVAAGSGALSMKQKTDSFARNIKKLEAGRIKAAIYANGATYTQDYNNPKFFAELKGPNSYITLDETLNKIATATGLSTAVGGGTATPSSKAFVVQSGANYYLLVAEQSVIKSYPCNSTGVVSGASVGTYTMSSGISQTTTNSTIIGTNSNKVFCLGAWSQGSPGGGRRLSRTCKGYVLDVASNGALSDGGRTAASIISAIDAVVISGSYTATAATGSYFVNNTAYCMAYCDVELPSVNRGLKYFTVDLTNTSVFTPTQIYTGSFDPNGNTDAIPRNGNINVGYDGTDFIYVAKNNDIFKITTSTVIDTTSNSFLTPSDGEQIKYRKTAALMSTAASNVFTKSDGTIRIKGVATAGTFSNLTQNNAFFIYKMAGSTEEDSTSSFMGMHVNCNVQVGALTAIVTPVVLTANGITVETQNFTLFPTQAGNRLNTNGPTLNTEDYLEFSDFSVFQAAGDVEAKEIAFTLSTANSAGLALKLGFGLYGGDYAAPSGGNDASGNTTDGWNYWGNASYLALSLT